MSDLLTEIRAALDDFCTTDWCAEKGSAAIEGVLKLHRPAPNPPGPFGSLCTHCVDGGPGYEADAVDWPCPTVKAIAKGLGIEVEG